MATEQHDIPISMHLAARLRGRSRLDFVHDVAVDASQAIRMSPEGFAEFVAILSRPATPVPEMVALLQRPAPWELGGKEAS